MRRRVVWRIGAALAVLALGVAGVVLLPRLARRYVVAEASRRGAELDVGDVHVRWLAVELRDVAVRLEGVEGVEVGFGSLRVSVDLRGRPTGIVARGGRVTVRDAETARAQLQAWRARRSTGTQAGGSALPIVDVELEKVAAQGINGGGHVELMDVHLLRDVGRTLIAVGSLEAGQGHLAVKASDAQATFDSVPLVFRSATLGSGGLVWILPARTGVAPEDPGSGPRDPATAVEPGVASDTKKSGAPRKEAPVPLPALLPDLHVLRGALAAVTASATASLPDGSRVHVDALSVRVQRGEEELALGSGSLDLDRDTRRIEIGFSTSPLAHATPLALRADFPTGEGDVEVSASGGPVSLGLLGMHDGGLLHLLDVDRSSFAGRGRLVLDEKGQALTFDVEGSVRGLSMSDPRLAHDPVRGMDLGVRARGVIGEKGDLRLDEAEASIGAARATVHGGFSQTPDHLAAAFDFDFPTSSCQALLTSVPRALLPTVGAARMDGTFSLRGRLAFDTRSLDAIAFDYDVNDRCRLVDVPAELDKARFAHEFTHVVYSKAGDLEEETTGPGSANWTDLDNISSYMQVAVLTTEDGAFFHHHGFSHAAIRHALIDDIKAGRFVRGASTITMQLAKNLFLSREKTLSRKLEELVLADYLEQAFTKDEMMELYLNIIEFGPDVYGVTAAAAHYFGRLPSELDLAECLFLSSILPNPVGFHRVYEKGAQPSDGWMRAIRARMELAAKNGLISPAELAEGLTENVTFHHEGDPPPTPRQPPTPAARRENGGDWEPLN